MTTSKKKKKKESGLGQIKRYVGVGNDVRQAACATVEI